MSDALSTLEIVFREQILAVPEAVACFGGRLYNTFPHSRAGKPFAVFQIVPLVNVHGQSHTPLIYRFLADFKIIFAPDAAETIDEAVEAVKIHFEELSSIDSNTFRLNIRFDNYISQPLNTKFADDKLLIRGVSFKSWMAKS